MNALEKREKIILNKSEYQKKDGETVFYYTVIKDKWKDKKKVGYEFIDVVSNEDYDLLDSIYICWQRTEFGGHYRTMTNEEIEKELESEDLPFSVELQDEE